MKRFFVEESAVDGARIYIENEADIHHLTRVLRSRVGESISVSDGNAWEYETEIEAMEVGRVVLRIVDKQRFAREPQINVTLFQGMPKGTKMETVIQKCVELGVKSIVPVFMERTVVVEKGGSDKKLVRWQRISQEAVKQCKRGVIPEVEQPLKFAAMVEELKGFDLVLCPYENEVEVSIKACLRAYSQRRVKKDDRVAIIIGPEGGFSLREMDALAASPADVKAVSLGKTILRTETAGQAALAMVMYELELD